MPSIVREISEWAASLPYWEQAALEKIVSGTAITDDVLDELLQYLLEDAGLAVHTAKRPDLKFSQSVSESDDEEKHDALRLKRISNLRNINALVPNQVLEFGDQLTIIFGSNGSGKSGYARVIASAAFTRGDKQILRDITKPVDETEILSADLEIEIGGEPIKIHHEIGQMCPEMRSFYVFDSTSVRAHLTHSNPMSFSPAGLEYLTRLVDVTDGVRKRLQQQIDQLNCSNPFALRFFGGETTVTQVINTLGAQTDLDLMRQLGTLSDEEVKRIQTLDREIAGLKSANIPDQIAELEQTVSDLNLLARALTGIGGALQDERITLIQQDIQNWIDANQITQAKGVEQFQTPWFQQTGSQVWHEFIQAAYQLSQAEIQGDHQYPDADSRCLLCQQPLDTAAQSLLHRLWEFLLSDARDRLEKAGQDLDDHLQQLQALEFDLLDDQAVSYRHLQEQDPQVLQRAQLFITASHKRRDELIQSIRLHQNTSAQPLPENGVREIDQLIGGLTKQRDQLVHREVEKEIQHLFQEKLELEHRALLAVVLNEIVQFVENARWIETASSARVKRNTAHISRKYNELFDRLVTQEYIRLFQDTLEKLYCPLLVRIATRAQKGTTIKQIVLQTDASISADQAPPEKILSEGEQRAVALADFFTEVRLDKQSCGVVLDDPVTSLDFQWKETIASHIVEEAGRQQVIIFTHDLHFLYLLREKAENVGIPIQAHWVEKREDKPGWVFMNNSPLSEKEYKSSKIPRAIHAAVKDPSLPSEEQQRLLREGFGALRTCYEAFVMYELFNGVVLRFEERTRIDQLGKVVIDPDIRDCAVAKMGLMSRYIEGHLHSDPYSAQKPTPDMLLQEIVEFEQLKQRHKEFKKSQGIKD